MAERKAIEINKINIIGKIQQPPPVRTIRPTLLWRPDLVVGIPVFLAIRLLAEVTPVALFQLKDKPGIPLFLRLLLITISFKTRNEFFVKLFIHSCCRNVILPQRK